MPAFRSEAFMRGLVFAAAGLLTIGFGHQVEAATPRSIAVLLGPSVGYLLSDGQGSAAL
jgi:hypothetical protein